MLEELKQIFEKYEGKINSIVQFIKMWRIAMTIYIALLRGINVGGHKIIKMADLKQTFESIGLKQVKHIFKVVISCSNLKEILIFKQTNTI